MRSAKGLPVEQWMKFYNVSTIKQSHIDRRILKQFDLPDVDETLHIPDQRHRLWQNKWCEGTVFYVHNSTVVISLLFIFVLLQYLCNWLIFLRICIDIRYSNIKVGILTSSPNTSRSYIGLWFNTCKASD